VTRRDGQLALADVQGVEVGYWDPLRRTGIWGGATRVSRPVRNFGDLLGPLIVRDLVELFLLPSALGVARAAPPPRLLSVGSILHFARDGDVVWGSGFNPKGDHSGGTARALDVRAVRGPRTAELLRDRLTTPVPEAFGDPALLLGALRPHLVVPPPDRRYELTILPNLNELAAVTDRTRVVNPRHPMRGVLTRIARSRLVVGSSLHAVIVAESLGVPARAVRGQAESVVKYEDYFRAPGRDPALMLADDVDDAIARGGAEPPTWDPVPLLAAFPRDLWTGERDDALPAAAIELLARRHRLIAEESAAVRTNTN